MTDDEIEVVAEELAKIGGTSWYPGREPGPLMRVVSQRYRDRARVAIAALERHRAKRQRIEEPVQRPPEHGDERNSFPDDSFRVGATVVYRPPGDRRAYSCRIEKLDGNRAYLVPELTACTGWVAIENLSLPTRGRTKDEPT